MKSVIYRRIPECDPALVAEAAKFSVADLHEAMDIIPGQLTLFKPDIRPLNPGHRVAGPATTAFTFPHDGLLGHKAIQLIRPGQVLVIANGGVKPQLMFAELIALAARAAGAAGVVVEGMVRDVEALRQMNFPVWCSGVYAGHVGKAGPGSINIPIVCGGVRVNPGDIVVADDDGVLCAPPSLLPAALKKAKVRAEREVKVRAAIAEGRVLFDLLDLEGAMSAAGSEEIDGVWHE